MPPLALAFDVTYGREKEEEGKLNESIRVSSRSILGRGKKPRTTQGFRQRHQLRNHKHIQILGQSASKYFCVACAVQATVVAGAAPDVPCQASGRRVPMVDDHRVRAGANPTTVEELLIDHAIRTRVRNRY